MPRPINARAFNVRPADPLRPEYEAIGRRVALHFERRDFHAVDAVVMDGKRFVFEEEHPDATPEEMPLCAILVDIRLTTALENFLGVITVGDLLKKNPSTVQDIPMIGPHSFARIQAALVALLGGKLPKLSAEWAVLLDGGGSEQLDGSAPRG